MTTEAALGFRQKALFQMIIQTFEEDASEDLPGDVQQGDSTVIVTDLTVPFSLVDMYDGCAFEVLRDFTLTSHLLEERSRVIHELGTSVLVDLSRDCVRSGCFTAGKLPHGPDGFLERWRKVENLCLLSQEGTAVGAEERSSAIRRWTVGCFDRGEGVLPLVAVRLALDLLSFAGSPGVLHLAQSLLKVAATTEESSSVVVSGVIYVGFVESVLLGEQFADGGVVLVETVLVLAAGAAEDG
nr:unnamed protein product [Spirometra erinaceieuropaei]